MAVVASTIVVPTAPVVPVPNAQEQLWTEMVEAKKKRMKKKHLKVFAQVLEYQTFLDNINQMSDSYQKRWVPALLDTLKPYFEFIESFSRVISTMVQANPTISALVWGGAQAILECVSQHEEAKESASETLRLISRALPRFESVSDLFPSSVRLHEILRNTYGAYVDFCIDTVLFYKRLPIWNFLSACIPSGIMYKRRRKAILANIEIWKGEFDSEVSFLTLKTTKDVLAVMPHIRIVEKIAKGLNTVYLDRNKTFRGRGAELAEIHKLLTQTDPPSRKSCVIHGLGGMGKSQTALEYSYEYRQEYSCVFWIKSETSIELVESFSKIAEVLGKGGPDAQDQLRNIDYATNWLRSTEEKWLVIFDNVEDYMSIRNYWDKINNKHGCAIITTQNQGLKDISTSSIALEKLPDDQGFEVLSAHLNITEKDRKLGETISELVGGLPLFLAHVAGYISLSNCRLEDFIKEYQIRDRAHKIVKDDASIASTYQYEKSMDTVFKIALERLNEDARNLLDIIAFFSTDSIQEDLLAQNHEHPSLKFLNETSKHGFIHLSFNLRSRHLIETANNTRGVIKIHRALRGRLLSLMDLDPPKRQRVFDQALHILRNATPPQDPFGIPITDKWHMYEKTLPHITSMKDTFMDSHPAMEDSLAFAELLSDAGMYMWERNIVDQAPAMMQAAQDICSRVLAEDDPDPIQANIIATTSSFLIDRGLSGRTEGTRGMKRVLKLRQAYFDRLEPVEVDAEVEIKLANAMNNLGCAYLHCEMFEEAEPLFHQSLQFKEKGGSLESMPYEFAESYKNLALVRVFEGNKAEAIRLGKYALKLVEDSLGYADPTTLFFDFMYAVVLCNCGEIDESLERHLKVLKTREEALDMFHNDVLTSNYWCGMMYWRKLDFLNAEIYITRALVLQAKHGHWSKENCARAHYTLSLVLEQLPGRELDAINNLNLARDFRKKVDEHRELEGFPDSIALYDYMISVWDGRSEGMFEKAGQPRFNARIRL